MPRMGTTRKLYTKALLLIVIAAFCNSVDATEYTISSASELNALSLQAGDVVIMKNGTWTNQELYLRGMGTESAPITLKAENGGQVILTGSSYLKMAGEYLVVDGLTFSNGALDSDAIISFRTSSSKHAYNSRLTNTKIINYNPSNKDTEYKWVSLYGQHNRIDHCHFEGKNHNGALLVVWLEDKINYHRIDNNYFGPRPDLGYNGGEIIRVGTSDWSMYDSYTMVENNLFEKCDGEIEIISNKSCNNTYRNNTFRACKGTLTLRHGNDCNVYNNFFFGVAWKDCGGIRIIGENHKVYNNYLQDIPDDGFRAAISITNGVPNSPLNRYFQVKNALVVNNTIVNCKNSIVVGSGANTELSLPPQNCVIANNIVAVYSGSTDKLIEYESTPENLVYKNNIMYGDDLGIEQPEGIEIIDPALVEGDIWRPSDTSVAIAYGSSDYDFLTFDIDLQSRNSSIDAGCDQVSDEEIKNTPLTIDDVGVGWANLLKEVSAAEGGQKLTEYINNAVSGSVITLTTAGEYMVNASANLKAGVVIKAADNLTSKPTIKANGLVSEFINIEGGGSLKINNIAFDGGSNSNNALLTAFTFGADLGQLTSTLSVSNCNFNNFSHTNGSSVVKVNSGTSFYDLSVINTLTSNIGETVYFFNENSYSENVTLLNCSYINIGGQAIEMPVDNLNDASVNINHCTFDSIGFKNETNPILSIKNARANIVNSVFSYANANQPAFKLYGQYSNVNYCGFWNTGAPEVIEGATLGTNNWINENPNYAARKEFIYTLLPGSYALNSASDGKNLGDLYWDLANGHANNNALLANLTVDNIQIEQFDPYFYEYSAVITDTQAYVIEATAQDENAIVNIQYPESIPGYALVNVLAQNGVNTHSYKLNLSAFVSNKLGTKQIVEVYPNPSNGKVFIKRNETIDNALLQVMDISGKIIANQELNQLETTIDLSGNKQGVYFVIVKSDRQLCQAKIILK